MKKLLPILAVATLLFAPAALRAQMALKLEFQKRTFLQYEPVIAKVTIRNDSGQNLAFGQGEQLRGSLNFEIMGRNKRWLSPVSDTAKILEGVILKPGESREVFVYLNRFYNIAPVNLYDIHCYITHPMLKSDYQSNHCYVEVSAGVTEWSRGVGIPDYMLETLSDADERSRTYKILSLSATGRKDLYVSIEDTKFVHRVRSICTLMGQEEFAAETDNLARLHMFVPVAPQEFKYIVIDLDGDVDVETQYRSTTNIPVLARDPQSGRVYVTGGEEIPTSEQIRL